MTAPELTVAMPAYNAGRFLSDAVASVLAQSGVAFELVIVDDGSSDDTARIAGAITDARVRLVRHASRRGIGSCHNHILAESDAPLVAHVDADDELLPGALHAMVSALRASPAVGQAFCDFETVDGSGRVAPGAEALRAFRDQGAARDPYYRRDLVLYGMVVNTLRTYRRAALATVGPFDETLRYGVDYEMALRLADRFPFLRVPRVLYRRRLHGANTSASLRLAALRYWWSRVRLCRRLGRAGRVAFLGAHRARTALWLAGGLADALGISRGFRPVAR